MSLYGFFVVVRWVLTLLLIWGVYTETGVWTALTITLILLEIEVRTLAAMR